MVRSAGRFCELSEGGTSKRDCVAEATRRGAQVRAHSPGGCEPGLAGRTKRFWQRAGEKKWGRYSRSGFEQAKVRKKQSQRLDCCEGVGDACAVRLFQLLPRDYPCRYEVDPRVFPGAALLFSVRSEAGLVGPNVGGGLSRRKGRELWVDVQCSRRGGGE